MNRTRKPKSSHGVQAGSSEANRLAVAILEVLAGARTPAEAAEALGVSLPRYYQLETRALNAMVTACEPRPRGKQPCLEKQLAELEKELQRLRKDCARHQALVRVAQRSVGLAQAGSQQQRGQGAKKAGRKKRRPTVRALKAAAALEKNIRQTDEQTVERTEGNHNGEVADQGNAGVKDDLRDGATRT